MIGTIDPFEGAGRASFIMCKWWKQVTVTSARTGKEKLDVVCYRTEPDGIFMAEEIQPEASMMTASGDIRYQRHTVTISTTNNVMGKIHENDLVEYDGRIWRVENISPTKIWSRSQFGKRNRSGSKVIVLVS
jgi:hypothetical protein